MPQWSFSLDLLTAMITPAVLISACGTLIFSTSTRLARVVDRVRELTMAMDNLYAGAEGDFLEERRAEVERQLSMHARRGRLIQWSLTSYYVSLGLFVGSAVAIGLVAFVQVAVWLPSTLGVLGTLALFYASVLLDAGESIRTLAESLGHADPGFTLRVYTHLMPSSKDRSRAAIDRVFGGSSPDSSRTGTLPER